MVSGKKILCYICNKKCSGNVLRYQDRYYHKQCFESEQLNDDERRGNNNNDDSLLTSPTNEQQTSRSPSTSTSHQHPHNNAISTNHNHPINGSAVGNINDRSNDIGATSTPNQNLAKQPKVFPTNNNGLVQQHVDRPASSIDKITTCAGCSQLIKDGQALIALDLHWHVWCFKCAKCQVALHGEYVAKDGIAYCEKDYQKFFGVICVYCKRYITGKVLQAGESHHFHPSCARCSKCGDPFVPGEEMYLQGEITWHPRCGPGPDSNPLDELDFEVPTSRSQLQSSAQVKSPSLSSHASRSRSASPISYMSRQYGRSSSPYGYADSEAVGDLSRIYTISYLNADPAQGYLRKPVQPHPPKSPQFSRPASVNRDSRSRSSSRSAFNMPSSRDRSMPRGMYSVLSSMPRSSSSYRARSPSMMNDEAIQLAHYPDAKRPSPGQVPKIERDDFPAPPFPYPERNRHHTHQRENLNSRIVNGVQAEKPHLDDEKENHLSTAEQRHARQSRPRSREIAINNNVDPDDEHDDDCLGDPQLKREEEELSKIASGIGKIFLQTLKEREKIRAWKRVNLDPRNASRTPSATRELPQGLRYDNPTNASPSRDLDRARPAWNEDDAQYVAENGDHSPTRTRSSLGRQTSQMLSNSSSSYGYKVVQSNRSTPRPGYGLGLGPYSSANTPQPQPSHLSYTTSNTINSNNNNISTNQYNSTGPGTMRKTGSSFIYQTPPPQPPRSTIDSTLSKPAVSGRSLNSSAIHLRRSMPNVNSPQQQQSVPASHLEPPKLYPFHLLVTSNYRLPPDVDRCHLERHLSNEQFQYIFNYDRLDFYRLPEWRRNELKRRAKLF